MQKTFLALSTLALSSALAAQCIPAPGAPIPVTQDSITGPNPIGFAFPFAGSTYTDIHISDHGICFLSNNGVPAPPTAVPLVYTPASASLVANSPVIAVFWSDTIPGASGTFSIDAQATACTITWTDVQSFGFPNELMTFQLVLTPNGYIEFRYDLRVNNNSNFGGVSDNGVVGVSPGAPATLPPEIDFRTSPVVATNTIFEDWLTALTFDMKGDSVLLIPTNPGWVTVHAPGGAGCASHAQYGAGCNGLSLNSNDPLQGTNWTLTTSGIDPISVLTFTYFAFVAQIPGQPLSAFGLNAPGCSAHINPLPISLTGTNSGGTSTVSFAIPAGLVGVTIYGQTIALTSANPSGLATSNGLRGTTGN